MIDNGHLIEFKTEAVARRRSVKTVFLEISQNSQENTCARDSGTGVSCEFSEIYKNTFSYRTPPVAAPVKNLHK